MGRCTKVQKHEGGLYLDEQKNKNRLGQRDSQKARGGGKKWGAPDEFGEGRKKFYNNQRSGRREWRKRGRGMDGTGSDSK